MAEIPSLLNMLSLGDTSAPAGRNLANPTGQGSFMQSLNLKTPEVASVKDAKAAEVAAMKDAIQNADQTAMALREGNDLGQTQAAQDLQNLSFDQLYAKDKEVAWDAERIQRAFFEQGRALNGTRSAGEIVDDSLYSARTGLTGAVLNPLAFGADLVGMDDTALALVREGQKIQEANAARQSPTLQARREANALRTELNQGDTARDYAENISVTGNNEGEFLSGLKRLGSDVLNSAKNTNAMDATDLVAMNIGNLAPSALAARAAMKAAGTTGVAAVVGGMEAGGGYAQAAQEVLGMSETDLSDSPMYAQLRTAGATHEEARDRVANATATTTGVTQLPLAVLGGRLAARFEAAPFAAGSVGEAAKNIVGQTVEEAYQSGTSRLAMNNALGQYVDPDQELLEGVGEDITQGAIGGLGMAGTTQAPALAAQATMAAGTAAVEGAKAAVSARMQAIESNVDAASSVNNTATQEAAVALEESIAAAVPDESSTPEMVALSQRMASAIATTPEYLATIPEAYRPVVEEGQPAPSKLQTTLDLVTKLEAGEIATEDQGTVILNAFRTLDELADIYAEVPGEFNEDTDTETNSVAATWDMGRNAYNTIYSNPAVAAVRSRIEAMTQESLQTQEITDENIESPEVAQDIQNVATLATVNPAAIDPRYVDTVLNHTRNGKLKLSEALTKQLKIAADVVKTMDAATTQKAAVQDERASALTGSTPMKTQNIVRDQIMIDGNADNAMPSLSQHMSRISTAMQKGKTEDAGAAMTELGNFAQHMINRIGAFDKSAQEAGKAQPFQAYGPFGFFEPKSKLPYLNLKSASSKALAKDALIDAQSTVNLYNNLARSFPELGMPEKAVPDLNRWFKDDAVQVAIPAEFVPMEAEPAGVNPLTVEPVAPEPMPEVELVDGAEVLPVEEPVSEAPTQRTPGIKDQLIEAEDQVIADEIELREEKAQRPDPVVLDPEEAAVPDLVEPEVEAPKETVEALYPKIGKAIARGFKIKPGKSKLNQMDQPVARTRELVNSVTSLPGEAKTAMDTVFDKTIKGLGDKLNARLSAVPVGSNKKANDPTISDFLNQGKNIPAAMRAANLVDPDTGKYDQRLTETVELAAADFLLNSQVTPVTNDEDVAQMFGVSEIDVTDEMRGMANNGMQVNRARDTLARTIMDFAGLSADSSKTMSDTKAMFQSLAAEALAAMEGDLVYIKKSADISRIGRDGTPITEGITSLTFNDEVLNDLRAKLKNKTTLLSDLLVPEVSKKPSIGAPHKANNQFQRNNPTIKLSKKELTAQKNQQSVPFKRNPDYLNFLKAMGLENFREIMGFKDVNPKKVNKVDLATRIGKNQSIDMQWNWVMNHDLDVAEYAEANGVDPNAAETFFEYYTTKVGRMGMEGFGPQANKLAREAFITTISEMDLTDPVQLDNFWLTVAQSSDLIKTEKVHRPKAVNDTINKMDEIYGESIEVLKDWMNDQSKALTPEQAAVIKREMGNASPKMLHALMAVARFYHTAENNPEGLKNFQHMLSLEADGKTDGPINAMINFITGSFTGDQLRIFAKGGFRLNRAGWTLNRQNTVDSADLYEETTTKTVEKLRARKNEVSTVKGGTAMMNQMVRLMDAIGHVKIKDGTIEIHRNGAKNPLTITTYGSGIQGIAGKVASGLMKTIYEDMSDLITARENGEATQLSELPHYARLSNQDMSDIMTSLFGSKIFFSKKNQKWMIVEEKGSSLDFNDPVNFEFTPEQAKAFTQNVRSLFVEPMVEAINDTMGTTKATVKLMQTATQVQALIFRARFDKALVEKTKAAREAGRIGSNELLSQDEYNEIFNDLRKYGAIVETMDQGFNMGSPGMGGGIVEGGRSFDETVRGGTDLPYPSLAGVAAAPNLTIGTGDARMILEAYQDAGMMANTLQIFDGVEIPANRINEVSEYLNKIVHDNWMSNTVVQDMHDSFATFLRNGGLKIDDLPKAVQTQVGELIEGNGESLLGELQQAADSIKKRQEVMKSLRSSTDHMASAESPFTNEGDLLTMPDGSEPNWDQLADMMNARMNPAPKKTQGIPQRMTKMGKAMGDVRMLSKQNVASLLKDNPVFKTMADTLPDMRYLIGSPENLTAARNELFPERMDEAPITLGQIDLRNGMVYIANPTEETLVHELVHATTMDKVNRYYIHNDLSEDGTKAMNRLVRLKDEFKGLQWSAETQETQAAVLEVMEQMKAYEEHGTPEGQASAMNEFLAWTLANPDLVKALKSTRIQDRLAMIRDRVIDVLKSLVGIQTNGRDMFSNILFNARVVAEESMTTGDLVDPTMVLQHTLMGGNNRLERVNKQFIQKIKQEVSTVAERGNARLAAWKTTNRFSGQFGMTDQEKAVFTNIQAVFNTGLQMDPRAMARVQVLYTHFMDQLTPEALQDDPNSTDIADLTQGQERYRVLTGSYGISEDTAGRTDLVSGFLALSQTNDTFRKALSALALPKDGVFKKDTLDNALTTGANMAMNRLASTISQEGRKSENVQQALDNLTSILGQVESDAQTMIEKQTNGLLDRADALGSKALDRIADTVHKAADDWKGDNFYVNGILQGAKAVTSLISKSKGKAYGIEVMAALNNMQGMTPVREFFQEIIGETDENRAVLKLVNKGKAMISAIRQDYRDNVPRILQEQFSRKVTKSEWNQLHTALGKTDMAALGSSFNLSQAKNLFTSKAKLQSAITKATADLTALAPKHVSRYEPKMDALAEYMISGKVTSRHFLRNAYAIAKLAGIANLETDQKTIDAIDKLVTLKAIAKLDDQTYQNVGDLFGSEKQGMEYLLTYLTGVSEAEKKKIVPAQARMNAYKGYVPVENQPGQSLIVADDGMHNKLVMAGYTRVGDYKGTRAELGKRGYYVSSVAGRATYAQGAMQTVQESFMGVNPLTGLSLGGITAGVITGLDAQKVVTRMSGQPDAVKGEALMPIFNAEGQVTAFERSMAPEMLTHLNQDRNLSTMVGVWRGRQEEENMATEFNRVLVSRIADMWKNARADQRTEFVDLTKTDDPILNDVWNTIPLKTKQIIEQTYGEDGFMVRKDLMNSALGYREASVRDVFTGASRLDPKTQKMMTDTATAILGRNAFKWVMMGEKGAQAVVSGAKNLIVIRSVVVPFFNILSNQMQMLARGVPLRDLKAQQTTKLAEINQHLANQAEKVKLETQLVNAQAQRNQNQINKLNARLKAIADSNKRMSIWPLLEAGEFSSIAEGLTDADNALMQGRWVDYMEDLVDRYVPKAGQTLVKYAMVSRDTALYKGLERAVQYGDFLAKATLYDHYTKRMGMKPEDAMKQISGEFVNYNLLPGRTRSYAESMGLVWFWNFKIRSIKVAHQMMRDNPVRALLMAGAVPAAIPLLDNGSPITDNMIPVAADGRLGYSMGWDMMLNSGNLNPWYNLMK